MCWLALAGLGSETSGQELSANVHWDYPKASALIKKGKQNCMLSQKAVEKSCPKKSASVPYCSVGRAVVQTHPIHLDPSNPPDSFKGTYPCRDDTGNIRT